MSGVNIERALQNHRQAEAAAATATAARNERYRNIRNRAQVAGALAKELTDIAGFTEDDTIRRRIYDTHVSLPISLGSIESEPGKHGFAKVIVCYGLDRVERQVKGRFFTHTEVDHIPNDTVQEVTVAYFAGDEAATGLEYFASYHWDITCGEDESAIAGVETGLAHLSEILGHNPAAPTE